MKDKSNIVMEEDAIPSAVKKKLERHKIERRLIHKQDLSLGGYITIKPNENLSGKKIKVILELLNFASLEEMPVIPRYGKPVSEVLRVCVTNSSGGDIKNKFNLIYSIKAAEVDRYCYPLLFSDGEWKMADHFEMESDGIKITDNNWNIVLLIKEPPNEVISVAPNGGMIYSELDKVTSLRIPKGNFKESVACKLQFVNLSMGNLEHFQGVYEDQLNPFVQLSPLFLLQLVDNHRDPIDDENELRRAISVKIPLPDWVIERLNDINFDTKTTVQDQRKQKLGFYVLQKVVDDWYFFEGNLKFTQNTLGFETKHFGSFIFVKCRENREIRLCQQMSLVEHLNSSQRGVILVFLLIKKQSWYLWLEIVPVDQIASVRESLENIGLVFIERSEECVAEIQPKNARKLSFKSSKKEVVMRKTIELFEGAQFKVSISGEIEADEDASTKRNKIDTKLSDKHYENNTSINDENDFSEFDKIGKRKVTIIDPKDEVEEIVYPDMLYHPHSPQSNAILLKIKPKSRPNDQWTKIILENLKKRSLYESSGCTRNGAIRVPVSEGLQSDIDEKLLLASESDIYSRSKLSESEKEFNFQCDVSIEILNCPTNLIVIPPLKYTFYIPTDTMKDHFNVLTKEELHQLEMERMRLENEQIIFETQKELDSHLLSETPRTKVVNYRRIELLSNPRTKILGITRDPKILSSKSMLALASVVRQGLTLAAYLSLPENVIAGIGFDSMSQMSMNGVNNTTYKVLVTWKKMIHINRLSEERFVEQLMDALTRVGYGNLSVLVYEHWKGNKDITIDDCHRCLLKRNDL